MNSFGRILRLDTFGESHGPAVGGILDGFPAGLRIEEEKIRQAMERRKPFQAMGSGRKEEDEVEILSGVLQGFTLGSPIAFLIRNRDAKSQDYKVLQDFFRPSHADDTYQCKYGIRDYRGGGRASARETAVRVAAGAMVHSILEPLGIRIYAFTQQIGEIALVSPLNPLSFGSDSVGAGFAGDPGRITSSSGKDPSRDLDWEAIYAYPTRCPHAETDSRMQAYLEEIRHQGDTVGGVVACRVCGLPKGLGEPLYDKLTARLASAMLGINACRGFEIGQGFKAARMRGSEHNDVWKADGKTEANRCGGVRGGISTGEDLLFRVAFKPVPTLGRSVILRSEKGELLETRVPGRHDICCVPRVVPVVEAMTALVLADFVLLGRCGDRDSASVPSCNGRR